MQPADDSQHGLIFDIQSYSVHDGPGTRTTVFLNGCPLRCSWCANPEGQKLEPTILYKETLCKNCPRRCIAACPQQAVTAKEDGPGLVRFDRASCHLCRSMECIDVCYPRALQLSGKWWTIDELMKKLDRERSCWGSDGGITLSGGEPLMQRQFAVELLRRCADACIGACVETCGHIPLATLQAAAPHVQWFFVDIKHMDPQRHREGVGVDNDLILCNIRWLADPAHWNGRLILRTPVIPGFNDAEENARQTIALMKQIGKKEINLLPFHRLGASKHKQLGTTYAYEDLPAATPDMLEPLARIYRAEGITCYLGSSTPF
jgi:glycyl-radical enzyme activating protein